MSKPGMNAPRAVPVVYITILYLHIFLEHAHSSLRLTFWDSTLYTFQDWSSLGVSLEEAEMDLKKVGTKGALEISDTDVLGNNLCSLTRPPSFLRGKCIFIRICNETALFQMYNKNPDRV